MIALFTNIPSPVFLIAYFVYGILLILYFKQYASRDYTWAMEVPEPTELTPLDIAYLKHGVKGAINTSIAKLLIHKGVDITKKRHTVLLKTREIDTSNLSYLDKKIYRYAKSEKSYKQLYEKGFIKSVNTTLKSNINRLNKMHLLVDTKVKLRHVKAMVFGLLCLLCLGGIKAYSCSVNNKPFVLLFIQMLVFSLILYKMLSLKRVRTSARGKKLLTRASERFSYLTASGQDTSLLADDSILYGVAIFGVAGCGVSELGKQLKYPRIIDRLANPSDIGYGCAGCSVGCGGGDGCGGGCGGCGGD